MVIDRTRGGRREGSGRKPSGNERVCIIIPPELIAAVRAAGERECPPLNFSAAVAMLLRFGLAQMEGKQ